MGRKRLVAALLIAITFACNKTQNAVVVESKNVVEKVIKPKIEFGFNLNDYTVVRDTVKKGDSFGQILEKNNIGYPQIFNIANKAKDSFDIRKINVGKPYALLCSKDSLQKPLKFIYQKSKENYAVVSLQDSIYAYNAKKPVTYVERVATGVIENNISETLDKQGISVVLAYKLADNIFAWTIDFRRLQKGDRFKVIYEDKYIDDTLYAGVSNVKAAFFEHRNKPFYAFSFMTDSVNNKEEYFNEAAKNLRRAFLKAPVQFSRISSRYNLKRRIAHYGYKVKPHRGTDFAAANGTPIMATSNGTITKSAYTKGNGKYVKIRHNATYETQYLHMSKRAVKVGQYVKQGDVIGYVGNTGSSSGNHVCYRFWKNGKQVDPFALKLPAAESIIDTLKPQYLEFIKPIKKRLDSIKIKGSEPLINLVETDSLVAKL